MIQFTVSVGVRGGVRSCPVESLIVASAHLEQRFVCDWKRRWIGVGVGVVGNVVGVGSCLFLGVDCATAAKIADKQP